MATIPSDEFREYLDDRPALHGAILGGMGLASAIACFLCFRSGERLYRGWVTLLTIIFLAQCAYRTWQAGTKH